MARFEEQLLGETLGLEIKGCDLSCPLSRMQQAVIQDAMARNPVLIFRDQHLTAAEFAVFAANFGHIIPGVDAKYQHPDAPEISFLTNVEADGSVDAFGVRRASAWHYDGSFLKHPPIMAMLYGIEIPTVGGGTLFADMYRAYETLPDSLRQKISDLQTVNHFGLGPEGREYFDSMTPERWATYHPEHKPLVAKHGKSGRLFLEFCMIHTAGFVGLRHNAGAALLQEVLDHATQPDNVYYHRWRSG
ncbi:MAG: TauD/TfdA dioxygenase family protein, partial [Alphaproteobacteria bacterium]